MRFHSGTNATSYDPEKYLKQYRDAGSDVNAMRRIDYAARKDVINAQKRAAYAARKNLNESPVSGLIDVKSEYLKSATPGIGFIKQDTNYDLVRHADEIKTAQWLHKNLGGDIVLLNEVNTYKAMRLSLERKNVGPENSINRKICKQRHTARSETDSREPRRHHFEL